jgi:hypothetical protein
MMAYLGVKAMSLMGCGVRVGRRLLDEDRVAFPWTRPEHRQRRLVLRSTLDALTGAVARAEFQRLAQQNLARWRADANDVVSRDCVRVCSGDWGEVTSQLTAEYGQTFAVLNMANAFGPGGAYVEGAPAQEENMFRRTDCHFYLTAAEMDPAAERYLPEMSDRLNAVHGRVFLDVANPRVCVRGPEDRAEPNLGYPWLTHDAVFPFYELRAAAVDLRDGRPFDPVEGRRRICAQLDTLVDAGVRYAVLSAFGCGAFRNPAREVASLYRAAIDTRQEHFDCVAFAIFYPGYGPDNFTPFASVFGRG